MTALDLDFVRARFPALSSGFVYLDNAGGSQTLAEVAARITDYLLTSNVQLGASYEISERSGARVAQGTQAIQAYINAARTEEVVLGSSTTSLLKTLSLCLAHGWHAGDEVIVSSADHEANVSPWMALREQGIQVRIWHVAQDGQLDLADLEGLLGTRTRLVALTHASNLLGTINPIRQIAARVHEHGALICVDGVAYAPHRAIDVQALDVDFYAFSFYKVYGPHYAVLYGRKALLDALPGFNHYFIDEVPYKLQPGNVNFELCYGLTALPDYFQALSDHHCPAQALSGRAALLQAFELIADHEERLAERLLAFLNQQPRVRIIGARVPDKQRRVPTVSFVVEGCRSEELARACDPLGIGIRFGDFYAKKLVADLDLNRFGGVVRVSMVHYNTLSEIDRLTEALARYLNRT